MHDQRVAELGEIRVRSVMGLSALPSPTAGIPAVCIVVHRRVMHASFRRPSFSHSQCSVADANVFMRVAASTVIAVLSRILEHLGEGAQKMGDGSNGSPVGTSASVQFKVDAGSALDLSSELRSNVRRTLAALSPFVESHYFSLTCDIPAARARQELDAWSTEQRLSTSGPVYTVGGRGNATPQERAALLSAFFQELYMAVTMLRS